MELSKKSENTLNPATVEQASLLSREKSPIPRKDNLELALGPHSP